MEKRRFAKRLRQNMTDAERLLWRQLRAHRLFGQKFRRQQPLGPYIVDFVHFGAKLIIECDGGQHNESASDRKRDAWLSNQGFQILRFWNHDILNNTESVLTKILTFLRPSPHVGEGPGGREKAIQQNVTTNPIHQKPKNTDTISADHQPLLPPSPLAGEGPGERGKATRKNQTTKPTHRKPNKPKKADTTSAAPQTRLPPSPLVGEGLGERGANNQEKDQTIK